MKNPELPCFQGWEPCVEGNRCLVHADCEHGCGDVGFFCQPPLEALDDPAWNNWEKYKVPCKCGAWKL